jgi:AraC-like DNA-binding protein
LNTFRAAILGNYIAVTQSIGLDPFAILKRAQIDSRWLDDPDAPLALGSVVQVLEETALLSGRDDFGVLLAENRVFSSLGPVTLLLEHEQSVRRIVQAAIEFRPLVNETLSIQIEEEGGTAFIHLQMPPEFATAQFMSHIVAVASAVLVDASGGVWHPDAAHFTHPAPQRIDTYARFFECHLLFGNAFDGLSCESAILDTPVPSAEPVLATYARRLLNLCPESRISGTFTRRVRDAIHLLLRHGSPTLSKVSANMSLPTREIQRLLRAEGQTFEDVLKDVRQELAIRYLTHSKQNLTQLAYNLGFANLGSFSRWFTGQFGLPPSTWRARNQDLGVNDASTARSQRQSDRMSSPSDTVTS